MDKELQTLIAVAGAELISLIVLVLFWRKKPSPGAKLVWSLMIVVPLLGPVFYFAFYNPPESNTDRARDNPDVYRGGPH